MKSPLVLAIVIALLVILGACAPQKKKDFELDVIRAQKAGRVVLDPDSSMQGELTQTSAQLLDSRFLFSLMKNAPDGASGSIRFQADRAPELGRPYKIVAQTPGDGEIIGSVHFDGYGKELSGTITFTELPAAPANLARVAASFDLTFGAEHVFGRATALTWTCELDPDCHSFKVQTKPASSAY